MQNKSTPNAKAVTFTDAMPQQFAGECPDSVDVVVIGAGVIGVCTAWHLAKSGVRVLLCEKGRVAGEQSSRNWGWIRQLGRDPAELPIMMESRRIWQSLSAEIGEDLGYREHGIIYLASSEKKMAARESWLEVARQHHLETVMIDRAAVEKQIQGVPGQWCGGITTPGDGRAEPWLAVPAIARAAHREGAIIRDQCAVRTLEQTNGQITAVITESGVVKCDRVVLAGGAWSSLFAANIGLRLPQLTVRSTVVATTAVPSMYDGNAADEKLAFRRRQDGGYTLALSDLTNHFIGPDSFRYMRSFTPALLSDWQSFRFGSAPAGFPDGWRTQRRWTPNEISPFERNRVLNPPPYGAAVKRMLTRFKERFPALGEVDIAHSWAGMIDTMPDVVPVIDHVPQIGGLTIATGFSGHGFGIGPGAAKVVAQLVQNQAVEYDLSRFRFDRFSDGTPIDLGPAL